MARKMHNNVKYVISFVIIITFEIINWFDE